jgi:hypothetical protein
MSAIPKNIVSPLHSQLHAKLSAIRTKKNFSPDAWVNRRVGDFLTYMQRNNLRAAIVAMRYFVDISVIYLHTDKYFLY